MTAMLTTSPFVSGVPEHCACTGRGADGPLSSRRQRARAVTAAAERRKARRGRAGIAARNKELWSAHSEVRNMSRCDACLLSGASRSGSGSGRTDAPHCVRACSTVPSDAGHTVHSHRAAWSSTGRLQTGPEGGAGCAGLLRKAKRTTHEAHSNSSNDDLSTTANNRQRAMLGRQ